MTTPLVAAIDGRAQAGAVVPMFAVEIDEKGKLTLPPTPATTAVVAQCQWLTAVLNLDKQHPVTGGEWQGVRGPEGHVALVRAGAPAIRFEPARHINTPMRLIEAMQWQRSHEDGPPHAYKGGDCRLIAHVVSCLCNASAAVTAEQEAEGIVTAFLGAAEMVDGLTIYGTGAQRFEAAAEMQRDLDGFSGRPIGAPKYLRDSNTGELVIRLSDLTIAARSYVGGSLARGWLDARMVNLGWRRVRLDGHAQPGREGRHGSHLRVDVYRGILSHHDADDDQTVTT